jgi:hypothetical protein
MKSQLNSLLVLSLSLMMLSSQSATYPETRGMGVPELPSPACDDIQVPDGQRVAAHLYAAGVQIYRWSGLQWEFVAPEAELYANACHESLVGLHYAGPTWEALDGGKVVAARQAGCSPSPGAIPWLRLFTTQAPARGRFARVTFIQRINTVGGTMPATPGTIVGEEARVPYTAEYLFFRSTRH